MRSRRAPRAGPRPSSCPAPRRRRAGGTADRSPARRAAVAPPPGRGLMVLGQGVDHLADGRGERRPEPEDPPAAGRARGQQGEGLVVVEPGELGPETGQQRESPVPATLGIAGYAGRRQRLDVAQHRTGGHLQLARQRVRGRPRRRSSRTPREAQPDEHSSEGAQVTVQRTAINPVTWSAQWGFHQGEVRSPADLVRLTVHTTDVDLLLTHYGVPAGRGRGGATDHDARGDPAGGPGPARRPRRHGRRLARVARLACPPWGRPSSTS